MTLTEFKAQIDQLIAAGHGDLPVRAQGNEWGLLPRLSLDAAAGQR